MKPAAKNPETFNSSEKNQLRQFVDALDHIDEEIAALREARKAKLDEAEGLGYSKKRIGEVLKERKRRRKATRKALDQGQLEFELYFEASGGDEAIADAKAEEVPGQGRKDLN